jgi:hypothetical protein
LISIFREDFHDKNQFFIAKKFFQSNKWQ